MNQDLFNEALSFLYYHEPEMDIYLKVLEEEGEKYNSRLTTLAAKLKTSDFETQEKFISAVKDAKFTKLLIAIVQDAHKTNRLSYSRMIVNREEGFNGTLDEQAVLITKHWRNNQVNSPILKRNGDLSLVVDKEKANELLCELIDVNNLWKKNRSIELHDKGKALIYKTLDYNGITMPKIAVNELIVNTQIWTESTSLKGDFSRLFGFTNNSRPVGVISAIILKLNGIKTNECEAIEGKWKTSQSKNNPMYTEFTAMKILARLTAYYSPVITEDMFYKQTFLVKEQFFFY